MMSPELTPTDTVCRASEVLMKVPAALWNSLDRKLPLLIAAAILVTVAVFSAGAYHMVQRVLLKSAGERLHGVSAPIALSLQESAGRQRSRYTRIARDPAISRFLLSGRDREAALAALARGIEGDPQPLPLARIELRNAANVVVLDTVLPGAPAALAWADRMIGSAAVRGSRAVIAPLFRQGDVVVGGSVVAVAAPDAPTAVGSDSSQHAPIGYIVDSRVIVGAGVQAIRDLVGEGAAFVVGSPDEGVWTDLERPAAAPPAAAKAGQVLFYDSSARGPGVGAATAIAGTPWVLWLEQPRAVVLAPIRELIGRLAILALIFVAFGAAGAWALSRQITRPIVSLAHAADRIAADAGAAPASGPPRDEVARLSDAFARMSARVQESTEQLEGLVAERTARLQVALSDLELAQRELVKKERLAMLGQLSSAVGHELRNPLGVMTNALYVIEQCTPDAPPMVQEYIGLIRAQISASERIVGDLLDTARVRTPNPEALDLRELVDAQVRHLGPLSDVAVDVQISSDLIRVRMDPLQLSQIIFNLFTNAVQAMPDGGTLTIVAQSDESAARVRLEIRDTGPGIPDDVIGRIFDPLFTTKARGLGLGLWVSQNLAANNGGSLQATSRAGQGATFTLEMPAAVEPAGAAS
jgi:signal transduction histidine kinase